MSLSLQSEDDYEDLLGQWSSLQAALALLLRHPDKVEEFEPRIAQYQQWMQDLLAQDTDVALYLLFQLAGTTTVGYSASHALVCAVLCQLMAHNFDLPTEETDALVKAAFTMNVAMTELQDELANQTSMPSDEQIRAIASHPERSAQMLHDLGLNNELLQQTIRMHHQELPRQPLAALEPAQRLSYLLQVVDRFSAMISPRETREGRSAAESIQQALQQDSDRGHQVGQALMGLIGLFPPGTPVRLQDGSTAMVRKRGVLAEQPEVAIVVDHRGMRLSRPQLQEQPSIASALPALAVLERLSHHQILRLGS
jgi:hypothetical protein